MTSRPVVPALTLRNFLNETARRKGVVIAIVLICVAIPSIAALVQEDRYVSTASILVEPLPLVPAEGAVAAPGINVETELQLAGSYVVAAAVRRQLDLAEDPVEILERVDASAPLATELLKLSYTASDPDAAATVANAFARQYLQLRQREALSELENVQASLEGRIEIIRSQLRSAEAEVARLRREALAAQSSSARKVSFTLLKAAVREAADIRSSLAQLLQEADGLDPERLVELGVGDVVDPATPPENPVAPRPVRMALVGAVFGLGVAGAWVLLTIALNAEAARSGARD